MLFADPKWRTRALRKLNLSVSPVLHLTERVLDLTKVLEIGYAMAGSGLILASIQLFLMRHLLRRFDHVKMHLFCMGLWPFGFLCLPTLNLFVRHVCHVDSVTGELVLRRQQSAVMWSGIAIALIITRVAALAYS